MPSSPIPRRTVLTTGGIAAGTLALTSLGGGRSRAAPPLQPANAALTGPLVAWVVLDLDQGGVVRLVEVDSRSQPVRTIAAESLPLMPPASAARRAHELAIRAIAASWGVPRETCRVEGRCITHSASGRSTGYTVWTDFA